MAFVEAEPLHEVCGLLLGAENAIRDIRPAINVADRPDIRFEIDPAVLLQTHRETRQGGWPIVGHYHSHPYGKDVPSIADAAEAGVDGLLWMIVADGRVSVWRTEAGGLHGRFHSEQLVVDVP